jgi:hypothetical protein
MFKLTYRKDPQNAQTEMRNERGSTTKKRKELMLMA